MPWLILLIVGLFFSPITIGARETVVLTTGEFPPLNSTALKHLGLMPRLVKEAFKQEEVDVEFKFYPWSRAYIESRDGNVNGTIQWFYSAKRLQEHYYSDPVLEERFVWFHLKTTVFDWQQLSDIDSDTRIGAMRGFTYTKAFYQAIENGKLSVQFISKHQQALGMLQLKRIDIFPENIDVGYFKIQQNFSPKIAAQFTHHPTPFITTRNHLLLSRKHPDSPRLLKLFNRGLAKLKASGRYDQFIKESRRGDYLK